MRAGLQSLLLRPTARPLALGPVVAASLIAAETLVLYPLKGVAPANALGVVYLLGVLVVAIGWGFWLAAATSLASALAFDYFHIPPAFGFIPTYGADGVALGIFLVVALLASTLAQLARSRAAEAHQRRREASSLTELQAALRRVATLVAFAGLPSGGLARADARTILAAAPTPAQAAKLTPARLRRLLTKARPTVTQLRLASWRRSSIAVRLTVYVVILAEPRHGH